MPFFSLLLIYNKDINISKGSYKVDLHHLIKAAGFVLATLLLYFQKWKKKFEIMEELSAQAQSQQVIWRIIVNGFSNFFQL